MPDNGVTFNVFEAMKYPANNEDCFRIDIVDKLTVETFREEHPKLSLEACIINSDSTATENNAREQCLNYLEATPPVYKEKFKELTHSPPTLVPSIQEPPKLELKQLPSHHISRLPVIIFSSLTRVE